MSWRVVAITKRCKLDLRLNYLVVRGDETLRIHLSEISTLIIETTTVSITTALLCELTKRKIKVIFCDEKHNPSSELVPYYGSHDTSDKVRVQVKWTEAIKAEIWTEIIKEKIKNQAILLERLEKSEAKLLRKYIYEVKLNDETNREGHAAKVYFNALFGMAFGRNEENYINSSLNYGYSIILSAVNREIVSFGYITQLGLFHDNMFNQFNLSCDLMEPFRPIVDEIVYNMQPKKFDIDEKIILMDALNKEVIIDNKKQYVNNAIKIYCKSVLDALDSNDISKMRFYGNEL